MLELIQITNDPAFARRCDALDGMRLWVDLERHGKAERQAGRNTFISSHSVGDVGRIKAVLRRSRLMVRVNPLHHDSAAEIKTVLEQGADLLMLPMFSDAGAVRDFCGLVAGRVPVVPLLETSGALATLEEWIDTPGIEEVYVGLNDLHLSQGDRFMFEPLARGDVDRVAAAAKARRLRFGFGGIARLNEGLLPGRDVLAEHVRLRSGAVILSRTFHQSGSPTSFEDEVAAFRRMERDLAMRSLVQMDADRLRVCGAIASIAGQMAEAKRGEVT